MTEHRAPSNEQLDAVFIEVEVDDAASSDPDLARKLEEVCPVDIFTTDGEGGAVRVVRENVDECVLCGLCLDAAPEGAVTVRKLYDGTELEL